MAKFKWLLIASLVILLLAVPIFGACEEEAAPPPPSDGGEPPPVEYTLYVGGCFALTGAYAEDMTASLAGYEDYVEWVNENKILAPWYPEKTIPDNVTFEVLWRDD